VVLSAAALLLSGRPATHAVKVEFLSVRDEHPVWGRVVPVPDNLTNQPCLETRPIQEFHSSHQTDDSARFTN
jgi:hypothetical protein